MSGGFSTFGRTNCTNEFLKGPQLEATMKLIMQYLTKSRERVNSGGRMWYLKMNN